MIADNCLKFSRGSGLESFALKPASRETEDHVKRTHAGMHYHLSKVRH